ncbi:MAG: hypothetical protein JNK87_33340 [Bryobacterales bacterium]|nr:hypothetical protein [Bryobacterales bacterium]
MRILLELTPQIEQELQAQANAQGYRWRTMHGRSWRGRRTLRPDAGGRVRNWWTLAREFAD